MALYLMQHGKCLPKEIDPDRPLSSEGIEETEKIATLIRSRQILIQQIVHSGKTRAKETAEIVAELGICPERGVHEVDGIAPLDDVTLFASDLKAGENMLVVGHLPFLSKLTSLLLQGEPEETVVELRNSGIVCLDRKTDLDSWHLCWAIWPGLVEEGAKPRRGQLATMDLNGWQW